ncbi:hypothetical protein LTR94_030077, partial [Friedmanniomyces endolithicus]
PFLETCRGGGLMVTAQERAILRQAAQIKRAKNRETRMKIAAEDLGRVSILMNNAAREGGGGILAGANIWERTIATNMMGAVYGVQHFLPAMLAADWPCAIVNTGSKQGITLPPGDTAYN